MGTKGLKKARVVKRLAGNTRELARVHGVNIITIFRVPRLAPAFRRVTGAKFTLVNDTEFVKDQVTALTMFNK